MRATFQNVLTNEFSLLPCNNSTPESIVFDFCYFVFKFTMVPYRNAQFQLPRKFEKKKKRNELNLEL